jgi:hypothetical protein
MFEIVAAVLLAAAPGEKNLPRKPARPSPPASAPAAPGPTAAQPPAASTGQAPAVVRGAPAPASAARGEPTVLAGADDARRVCELLSPVERFAFPGDAVERGTAEASREEERQKALDARYRIEVPAERIRFAPYAPDERTLSLYRHQLPATADGALRLHVVEDGGLPVEVDVATARRILAAHKEKKLVLRVAFVTAEEDESPCFHVAGTKGWTLSAEPVAWEYLQDGQVIARGGQGADRPLVSVRDGARPRVRVGKALDAGEGEGRELRLAAMDRLEEVEACYATALDRDPWLDGAVVADLALPEERGAPGEVKIAADTVQDEELVECVRTVLATLEVRGGPGRAWLPIHFALDPPGAGAGGM